MIGIAERACRKERGDPALPRDQLAEALRCQKEFGIGEQAGQRRGEARQKRGVAQRGNHRAEIGLDALERAILHFQRAQQLDEFARRQLAIARVTKIFERLERERRLIACHEELRPAPRAALYRIIERLSRGERAAG
jgi:hypothetical protein